MFARFWWLALVAACSKPTDGGAVAPLTPPPAPASAPASAPHGAIEAGPAGAPFSGLVQLAEGIDPSEVKPTDVLFVMARESQGNGFAGRLVAVQRVGQVQFPKRYEIGISDVMVPGIPFKGPFIVTARLDRDGDPMTRGEDDLYATFATPVEAGQEGVMLVLKKGAPKEIPAPPGINAPPAPNQPASAPH